MTANALCIAVISCAGIAIIAVKLSVRTHAIVDTVVHRARLAIAAINLRIDALSVFTKIFGTAIAIVTRFAGGNTNSIQTEIVGAGVVVIAADSNVMTAEAITDIC